jgi:hypothetical protein
MAKIDLKFLCNCSDISYIKVQKDDFGVCISGLDESAGDYDDSLKELRSLFYIYLDKSTAIKFAKTLRTEINKIES